MLGRRAFAGLAKFASSQETLASPRRCAQADEQPTEKEADRRLPSHGYYSLLPTDPNPVELWRWAANESVVSRTLASLSNQEAEPAVTVAPSFREPRQKHLPDLVEDLKLRHRSLTSLSSSSSLLHLYAVLTQISSGLPPRATRPHEILTGP
jgi:hypothetical protein